MILMLIVYVNGESLLWNGEMVVTSTVGSVNMSLSTNDSIFGHASNGYRLTTSYNNHSATNVTSWTLEHIRAGYTSYAYTTYDLIVNGDTVTFDARDCDFCDQTSTYGTDYITADVKIRYNGNDSWTVYNDEDETWQAVTTDNIKVQGNDRKTTEEFYTSCYGTPSAPTNLSYTTNANDNPVLSWDANTERDFDLYRVYRGSDDLREPMAQIGTCTTNTYTDTEFWVAPVEEYQYYVKAEDWGENLSGASNEIDVVGYAARYTTGFIPSGFALNDNYPNPFNPTTTIGYAIPEKSIVTLKILDFLGKEVKTLVSGSEHTGYKQTVWNGVNNAGHPVASGVYFLIMDAKGIKSGNHFIADKKLVLIK